MKRAILILALVVMALSVTGCTAIAKMNDSRAAIIKAEAEKARAQADKAWAETRAYEAGERFTTERANILATNERAFYATLLALQQGQITMAEALAKHAPGASGTDHQGGVTASIAAGVGVGWPVILGLVTIALWALLIVMWRRK